MWLGLAVLVYMPGRIRTGSRPSSTVMSLAEYPPLVAMGNSSEDLPKIR
jgi:hypothetical protein